jgi:NTE family protein
MANERPATRGVGLALSGGGARGLAHIGVLKVFESEGLPIGAMSGASMGGIIAAAFVAGWSPYDMEGEARRMSSLRELRKLIDLRPPRRGLLAGNHMRDYLARFIPPDLTFAALNRPLALVATDLLAGGEIELNQGSVLEAVLATSAFPGVFPAVEWQGRKLVDGGVLNNLPVDLVWRLGARVTVAVDVVMLQDHPDKAGPNSMADHLPGVAQDVYSTVMLMTRAMTRLRLQQETPEVLIQPKLPPGVGIFTGFLRAEEIIASGEQAALRALPQVMRALEQDQHQNQ